MYPEFVNDKPPVVTLAEYDGASWASTTCLDFRNNQYVVVIMEEPEKVVAVIDSKDYAVLNRIFQSAHAQHAEQSK
ncbi:hypothetical protein PICST_62408 [Scheffersomyces stipitis CBS 6054]|uniref:Uncharacterized protein n=1 Tax=Scheffersomyces stipitis (strain ATCC 58785 / CBS 6054 / NBRC 10063 / NRRL Y-11545) TaxID=322104 RepID=A3LXJ1_PICST|nr:hypothetical protein PICST_62408 [Scheffersomyces stipitis CBS 6054]ABN67815.2 hypothetical protein PICST_62408 [Scheffersomyces stipitis CBS 6054]KAG2732367.1 hypothetical protein G9P44_004784 [Scheffersomyces stipitis]